MIICLKVYDDDKHFELFQGVMLLSIYAGVFCEGIESVSIL